MSSPTGHNGFFENSVASPQGEQLTYPMKKGLNKTEKASRLPYEPVQWVCPDRINFYLCKPQPHRPGGHGAGTAGRSRRHNGVPMVLAKTENARTSDLSESSKRPGPVLCRCFPVESRMDAHCGTCPEPSLVFSWVGPHSSASFKNSIWT